MPRNLEIKARIRDIQECEKLVQTLPASFAGYLNQIDTYFRIPHDRLKLREINGTQAELIYYRRDERSSQRTSDYIQYACEDASTMKRLLTDSLGVLCIVHKRRTLYMYQTTRIHLDEVKNLGSFLELETPIGNSNDESQTVTNYLIGHLGMKEPDFITCSYLDLMLTAEPEKQAE